MGHWPSCSGAARKVTVCASLALASCQFQRSVVCSGVTLTSVGGYPKGPDAAKNEEEAAASA